MKDQKQYIADKRREASLHELQQRGQRLARSLYTTEEAARFVSDVLEIADLSPSQLALSIGVAPQTVNRWIRKNVSPRAGQLKKLSNLLDEMNPAIADTGVHNQWTGTTWGEPSESIRALGIHFLDAILALEVQARDVWVLKCGSLREAVRGSIGEAVLQGLKNGTNFHYVFLAGSAAEQSFVRQLEPWLKEEKITGSLIGYGIKDCIWAGTLGLTQTPGAWIAIEYSESQALRLHRRFDVFKAISVREYRVYGRETPTRQE